MKILFDFKCKSCGKTEEKLVEPTVWDMDCSCGGRARRIIGTPTIALEGITGAFPGAHSRWAKIREDKARIARKRQG